MDRKRYCLRSSTNKLISVHQEEIQINWQFPGLLIEYLQFFKTNRTSCFILPKRNRRILLKARLKHTRNSLPFSRQGYRVLDSPANLYRDFMPTRMKLGKVFLSNFATLRRSASTEADVLHKCRLPSQNWATLLCRNASGQNSACQCFLAIQPKATVITLFL